MHVSDYTCGEDGLLLILCAEPTLQPLPHSNHPLTSPSYFLHCPPSPPPLCRWKPDMAVICYQGDHAILAYAVGIPGLVLVALFLPMASAWYLVRNKWVRERGWGGGEGGKGGRGSGQASSPDGPSVRLSPNHRPPPTTTHHPPPTTQAQPDRAQVPVRGVHQFPPPNHRPPTTTHHHSGTT